LVVIEKGDARMILPYSQSSQIERAKSLFYHVAGLDPKLRGLYRVSANNEIIKLTRVLRKVFTMPKRQKTSSSSAFKFNGYVNISIPETMAKDAESKMSDAKWVFASMAQAISDGYNLKVYYHNDDNHFAIQQGSS